MVDEEIQKETAGQATQEAAQTDGAEDLVTQAVKAAERLEAAVAENNKILARQEKLFAEMKLSGRSFAGTMAPQLSEEEVKKNAAKEFFKGSPIIEEALNRYG